MTLVVPMGYAAAATTPPARAHGRGGPRNTHGVCLLRRNRTVTASAAPFESLRNTLSSHRAITRVSLAALSFTLLFALGQQSPTQAVPEPDPRIPESLLPQSVGVGVASDASVTIPFQTAMNTASVEDALQILPEQPVSLAWDDDDSALTIQPEGRWRTDERYLLIVGQAATTEDGTALSGGRRFSFTTVAAPTVTDFQVHLAAADLPTPEEISVERSDVPSVRDVRLPPAAVTPASGEAVGSLPPTSTAREVSATSSISIAFSAQMDASDTEAHFAISPEVDGELSWQGDELVFTPSERLEPGGRYTVSLIGAHDRAGNVLGGKANFSFIVNAGAQLTRTTPELEATDVEPPTVEMWFSAPMDVDATNAAFGLTDTATGALVGGRLTWNEDETQLVYTPDRAFTGGRTFTVELGPGARDADGNAVETSWSFTTAAAPQLARAETSTRSAPVIPAAAASSDLVIYALNQMNAARAAYGFAPLALDDGITAVATAHAVDQVTYGYYSHTSGDGTSLYGRLAAGGVGFSAASENQCHYYGQGAQATLEWCHSAFMSEPYPGHWNHIANILNPRWTRVGVGIGDNGSHVVITWDFTD